MEAVINLVTSESFLYSIKIRSQAIRARGKATGRAQNAQKRSEEAIRARVGARGRAQNAQKRSEEAIRARGRVKRKAPKERFPVAIPGQWWPLPV